MSFREHYILRLRKEFVTQYLSAIGNKELLVSRHFKWMKNYRELNNISKKYFKENCFSDYDYSHHEKISKYIDYILNYDENNERISSYGSLGLFSILYKKAKRDFRLALKYYYSHQNDWYSIGEKHNIYSIDELREMFLSYLQDEFTFACALVNTITKGNSDIYVLYMLLITD